MGLTRSILSILYRFAVPTALGLVAALSAGTASAQLTTQLGVDVNIVDPLQVFQQGQSFTVPTLNSMLIMNNQFNKTVKESELDSSASASASFFYIGQLPGGLPASVNDFQSTSNAVNITNPPAPLFAVPTTVASSSTFISFATWTIDPVFASALRTAAHPNDIVFEGNTYDLSSFGIQVNAGFNFDYSIQGNALARVEVDLAGQAFPQANLVTGILGSGGGLSQIDDIVTVATQSGSQPEANVTLSGRIGTTPPTPGATSFNGGLSIIIDSARTGTDALASLLGLAVPEVFNLNFEVRTAADASGNVFNSTFPEPFTECDPLTNPNCVLAFPGANMANAMSTDPDITSINIVDANGQIVPFFSFQTLDGLALPSGEPANPPAPVPEPSSLAIFGSAFAGFILIRRRRRG